MAKARTGRRFPLWWHKGGGQWCKKINGRNRYFGTDKAAAQERYERERKFLEAGRDPPAFDGSFSVAAAANHFLTAKRRRVDSGELVLSTWAEYHQVAAVVVETFGKEVPVKELRPEDFARLRAAEAKRIKPVSLAKFVTVVRMLFNHSFKAELIPVPVRFGTEFVRPSKRAVRLERQRKGPRLIEAADVWKLLERADPRMKAMILLGLNCGYGQMDCSNLERRHLKRPGWVDAPRTKTGTPRRCPLWPETVEALKEAEPSRPAPADPAHGDRVFLSATGERLVRHVELGGKSKVSRRDLVNRAFVKLAGSIGLKLNGGFYILRHTHRTVSDETKDQVACAAVMGHVDASIADHYREGISDARLLAVTDHVRAWLLAAKPGKGRGRK